MSDPELTERERELVVALNKARRALTNAITQMCMDGSTNLYHYSETVLEVFVADADRVLRKYDPNCKHME